MKSFLKYAGGKYAILSRILPLLPPGKRLFEPFVGGGSVFLNATGYEKYIIGDANARLMDLWEEVRRSEEIIERTRALFAPAYNTAEAYEDQRRQFRAATTARDAMPIMIYLNRHGYNGLWRESKKTGFNVPFGRYANPYFPEAELRYAHEHLAKALIMRGDFEQVINLARHGDTVYCDPPFVPLTKTANFTGYGAAGFTQEDQVRLRDAAIRARSRGANVLISNHHTYISLDLYQDADYIETFQVASQISCAGDKRVGRPELLALYSQEETWIENLHQKNAATSPSLVPA